MSHKGRTVRRIVKDYGTEEMDLTVFSDGGALLMVVDDESSAAIHIDLEELQKLLDWGKEAMQEIANDKATKRYDQYKQENVTWEVKEGWTNQL